MVCIFLNPFTSKSPRDLTFQMKKTEKEATELIIGEIRLSFCLLDPESFYETS